MSAFAQPADDRAVDVTTRLDGASEAPDDALDLEAVEAGIVEGANRFRAAKELGELDTNEALAQAAEKFARYMASHDVMGHTANGQTPVERAEAAGYDYCIVLENLAYEYRSWGFEQEALVENLVEGWKNSPPHRENLLDPDVTETGVGVVRSAKSGTYYAAQLFGLPDSAQREFTIDNASGGDVRYRLGDRTLSIGPRYIRTHTICRPAELTFLFDDATTYTPTDGTRYTLRGPASSPAVEVRKSSGE